MRGWVDFWDALLRGRRVGVVAENDPPPPSPEQFTAFCAKYLPKIIDRLKRIGVRDADIEDVAQRVLLKVYDYFHQIPAEGVEAWLFVICTQQAATHYRPQYQRMERPELADYPMPEELDEYERFERAQFVGEVLKTMDPQLADILVRHVVDEKALPILAKELGISRNTAQRRVEEAKRSFERKAMQALQLITPARRGRLMLLPFDLGAFLERRSTTTNSTAPPSSGDRAIDAKLPTPSIRRPLDDAKQLLERLIKNPLAWWGVLGPVGAYALGASMPDTDALAPMRHIEPLVIAIAMEGGETPGGDVAAPAPSTTASVPAPSSLPLIDSDLERRAFERARRAMKQQRYSEALEELRRHEQAYPDSQYKPARDKYIAEALAALAR